MFDAAMFSSLLSAVFTKLVPQAGGVGQKLKSDGGKTPVCHLPWALSRSTTFNNPEGLARMPGGYPRPTPAPEEPIQTSIEIEDSELSSDDEPPSPSPTTHHHSHSKSRSASNPFPLPAPSAAPAASPTAAPTQPYNITDKILTLLTNPPPPIRRSDPIGAVYILPALHNGRPVLKIGMTKNKVTTRTQPIKAKCRSDTLTFPPKLSQSTIWHRPMTDYNYQIVERLVQAELHDALYLFTCVCGKQHQEWFDVPREVAERVVERWARFCDGRPWEEGVAGKELRVEWKVRVERLRRMGVLASSSSFEKGAWEEKAVVWERFVEFGWRGRAWHDVCFWAGGVGRFLAEVVLVVVLLAVLVLGEGRFAWAAVWMLLVVSWWLVARIGGFRCVTVENLLRR